MSHQSKQHIILDSDITEFLQDFTARSGFPSVTYSAHFLLRMIRSAEITTDVQLKDNVPMPVPATSQKPIAFRKKIHMKIKM